MSRYIIRLRGEVPFNFTAASWKRDDGFVLFLDEAGQVVAAYPEANLLGFNLYDEKPHTVLPSIRESVAKSAGF